MKSNYETKLWSKPVMQKALADMRKAGFNVEKKGMGYYVYNDHEQLVLQSLKGKHDYFVSVMRGVFNY